MSSQKRPTKQTMLTLRIEPDLVQLIDDWRREEPDLPVRSEAVRRMLKAEGERRAKGKRK
jgi:hypothetical protein